MGKRKTFKREASFLDILLLLLLLLFRSKALLGPEDEEVESHQKEGNTLTTQPSIVRNITVKVYKKKSVRLFFRSDGDER